MASFLPSSPRVLRTDKGKTTEMPAQTDELKPRHQAYVFLSPNSLRRSQQPSSLGANPDAFKDVPMVFDGANVSVSMDDTSIRWRAQDKEYEVPLLELVAVTCLRRTEVAGKTTWRRSVQHEGPGPLTNMPPPPSPSMSTGDRPETIPAPPDVGGLPVVESEGPAERKSILQTLGRQLTRPVTTVGKAVLSTVSRPRLRHKDTNDALEDPARVVDAAEANMKVAMVVNKRTKAVEKLMVADDDPMAAIYLPKKDLKRMYKKDVQVGADESVGKCRPTPQPQEGVSAVGGDQDDGGIDDVGEVLDGGESSDTESETEAGDEAVLAASRGVRPVSVVLERRASAAEVSVHSNSLPTMLTTQTETGRRASTDLGEARQGVPLTTPTSSEKIQDKAPEMKLVLHGIKRRSRDEAMWKRVEYELGCSVQVCLDWLAAVQHTIAKQTHRPKNLLVFVNPYGGRKKAASIYAYKVAPLFRLAGINTRVIETTHQHHAQEVVSKTDLSCYDGVVVCGGDGFFNEILKGLMGTPYTHLRIGMIPAGSTNTIVYSTTGIDDPQTSALHIVLGDKMALDVASVRVDGQVVAFCVSVASYGFFGDVVKDSEAYRWMGPIRYDYAGIKTYFTGKAYSATVSYKLAPNQMIRGDFCQTGCSTCPPTPPITRLGKDMYRKIEEEEEAMSHVRRGAEWGGPMSKSFMCLTKSKVEEGWSTVTGDFVYINACIMSCRAPGKCVMGISPFAHLADGCMDLILVKNCNHAQYLAHLLRMQNGKGDHFDFDYVETHRVTEFMMECGSKETQWSVDGELLEAAHSIHFKVHSNMVHLFARRPEPPRPKVQKTGSALSKKRSSSISAEKIEKAKEMLVETGDNVKDLQKRVVQLEDLLMQMNQRTEQVEAANMALMQRVEQLERRLNARPESPE